MDYLKRGFIATIPEDILCTLLKKGSLYVRQEIPIKAKFSANFIFKETKQTNKQTNKHVHLYLRDS
jgi:hypothetical protein